MTTLSFSPTDIVLVVIFTSGLMAGVLSYLMVPSPKRELQHCLKSILFGILFALVSNLLIHFAFEETINGVPSELKTLFLWCVSFLPAFIMALAYGMFSRRYANFEL